MPAVEDEILRLEEQLRQAELGPDPAFFEVHVADNAVIVSGDGKPAFAKAQIVDAHRPGKGPKFIQVEMSDLKVTTHESAAVVTCTGTYATAEASFKLRFLRVWVRKAAGWQIVAGTVANEG
ncbi:MAG TPA: nuclear transport factor 2 family protein [Bryobacteraceae bacterium]|nr:nuclear transport factor 2 family protein [Bryobacteraceae bacterium]